MSKPNVFIGCSKEGLSVAQTFEELLANDANVNVWTSDTFRLGGTLIEALVAELDRTDYAMFVLTPDDRTIYRGSELPSPRDNVVFEVGLFMGRLGRYRTFLVCPQMPDQKLPTDLSGLVYSYYDSERFRDSPKAALGPTANEVRRAIQRNVDPLEVDFIRAYLKIIEKGTRLTDSYSRILSRHYDRLCSEVARLETQGNWNALLDVKIRLREYFEFSGKYDEGVKFGRLYIRALEELHDTIAAHWVRVKHVAWLLILAGKHDGPDDDHDGGRKELQKVIDSPSLAEDRSDSVRELLFYCHRYMGVSYLRDEAAAYIDDTRLCFGKAQEFVDTFEHASKKRDELQARLFANYGNLALYEGQHSKALELFEQSLHMFKTIQDTEHIGIANLQIAAARVEGSIGLDLVQSHLDIAQAIAIRIDWYEGQGRIYYVQAALHERLADGVVGIPEKTAHLRNSLADADRSKTHFEHIDNRRWLGRAEEMITRIKRKLGTGAATMP